MSRLNELIGELCPDGVEYKKLWEVTIWNKRFNSVDNNKQPKIIKYHIYKSNDLDSMAVEDGNIRIMTTYCSPEDEIKYTTYELAKNTICEGEIIVIPGGGNACIQYHNGEFITADNRIATSIDTEYLNNRFLYFYLLNNLDTIKTYFRGAGIKHPDMSKILEIPVPVPPLPVQLKIVRILGNYNSYGTELLTELTIELTARKKQYEYYRDELLTFGDNVEYKKIKDIYKRINGTPITAGKMKEIKSFDGDIRIFAGGKTVVNAFEEDIPNANITRVPAVLVQSRGVIDVIFYEEPFTFKNEMWAYTAENKTSVKYLYYVLKNSIQQFRDAASGTGSMPQISLKVTEEFVMPVPSLAEQERIVAILDRFDTLCNDLTSGLPAEIEARRKQHEYYRDKLLTFKEKTQ